MSFWLEDIAGGDDAPLSQFICPNCTGTTFYDDPITNIPTCASCFTQSQTATKEEFGEDDAYAIAGGNIHRRSVSVRSGLKGNVTKKRSPLSDYDRSKKLPNEQDCCDAFEWLLYDAAKCVAKLIELEAQKQIDSLEQTIKEIWTRYRAKWKEATNFFSKKYPECRFAFRDFFLHNTRKSHVMRHLSISVGKKVEEDMINEIQMNYYDMDDDEFHNISMIPGNGGDGKPSSVSASEKNSGTSRRSTTKPLKKKMRRTILTVGDLINHAFPPSWKNNVRYPNGIYEQHPLQAVVKIYPSLHLILSILQLALTHLKLGIAPYQLTTFVAKGLLPHALNGYALFTPHMQERVEMIKSFFMKSFVPPADVIQDLADLLATATDWYGSEELDDGLRLRIEPRECLYNVKILAERMVKDFGLGKKVLANAFALMGDNSGGSNSQNAISGHIPERLNYIDELCTPLHVAALIVVACKFCPDWETWNIIDICNRSKQGNGDVIVPWCESQFLLNGRQIDHFLRFLENTAFNASDAPSENVSDFFQTLEDEIPTSSSLSSLRAQISFAEEEKEEEEQALTQGVPHLQSARPKQKTSPQNPNSLYHAKGEIPTTAQLLQRVDEIDNECDNDESTLKIRSVSGHFGLSAPLNNQFDYITTYQVNRYKQKRFRRDRDSLNLVTRESSHPQYCMLLEYFCFVMEEPDAYKLHELVAEIEDELFPATKKKWACKLEGCTSHAKGGGYCSRHGEMKKSA